MSCVFWRGELAPGVAAKESPPAKRSRRADATAWGKGLALVAAFAGVVALVVWLGVAWNSSRVPGSFGALELGPTDYGGGAPVAVHEHHVGAGGISVVALREPQGNA